MQACTLVTCLCRACDFVGMIKFNRNGLCGSLASALTRSLVSCSRVAILYSYLIRLVGCRLTQPAGVFLAVEGDKSRDLFVTGNDLHCATRIADFSDAASSDSLVQQTNWLPHETDSD